MKRNRREWSLVIHSRRRAKQRYGINLNRKQHAAIVAAIKSGPPRANMLTKDSPTRSLWSVPFGKGRVMVIYDEELEHVVTFLEGRCTGQWVHEEPAFRRGRRV